MASDDLSQTPASDLSMAIRAKRVSPVEVVEADPGRLQRLNPRLNSFCTATGESARNETRAAEATVVRGDELGPLSGVPLSVKDLVVTRGARTPVGSYIYGGIAARLADFLQEWRPRIYPGLVEVVEEGRRVGAIEFTKATFARATFTEAVRKFFLRDDLLLTPMLAVPPFAAGLERPPNHSAASRLVWVAFAYPFNLTGQPAATVPCGFTRDGLPIGFQVGGRRSDPHNWDSSWRNRTGVRNVVASSWF